MSQQQNKRMGGMTLGDFGKTPPAQPKTKSTEQNLPVTNNEGKPEGSSTSGEGELRNPDDDKGSSSKPKAKRSPKPKAADKLTTVNIKIGLSQQQWLSDTARQVRDNNDKPVAPADRVYPQHLIGVAIDLLKAADVDWDNVQNIKDLREALGL